jgi:hypothetical protein
MHHEYDELQKSDAMQKGRLELMKLEYEEQQVECLGRTLKKNINSSTAEPVSNFKYWTQVWKMISNSRDNAHLVDCSWLCPGIAACGAVLLKWLLT